MFCLFVFKFLQIFLFDSWIISKCVYSCTSPTPPALPAPFTFWHFQVAGFSSTQSGIFEAKRRLRMLTISILGPRNSYPVCLLLTSQNLLIFVQGFCLYLVGGIGKLFHLFGSNIPSFFSITLAVFKIFPLLLAFSKLIIMCLDVISFVFILLGIFCTYWIWFYSFLQIWKMCSHYSTKYYCYASFPPFLRLLLHLCQTTKSCTPGH